MMIALSIFHLIRQNFNGTTKIKWNHNSRKVNVSYPICLTNLGFIKDIIGVTFGSFSMTFAHYKDDLIKFIKQKNSDLHF